jgi:hypothetical protein
VSIGRIFSGWVVLAVLAFVALYALGYVINPFGPSCVTHRPWIPFRPTLPLWVVLSGAPALATFFVGMFVALGRPTVSGRVTAIVVVLLATAAAATVGLIVTPMCT